MPQSSVKDPSPPAAPSPLAHRVGYGMILAATALLFLSSRRPIDGPSNESSPREARVPRAVEPIGDVDEAPTRFRWIPSGPDAELSQVIIYGADAARLWETAPTESSEVSVPVDVFAGIRAGEKCYWRVREVSNGKALAASGMTRFVLKRDLAGNEAPAALLGLPLPPGTPPPSDATEKPGT